MSAVRKLADFDCGKAEGSAIQAFRDAYVPQVYDGPSPFWFYADAAMLAMFLGVGVCFFLRKAPARWISLQLALAFLYFGIFRGGCLCPVGATGNVAFALLDPERIGRAELALFLLPLLAALACGRVFCGAVCPLGAVQQFVSPAKAKPLSTVLHRILLCIPLLVLVLTVMAALRGEAAPICRFDPFKAVFFQGYLFCQKIAALFQGVPLERGWFFAGGLSAWLFLLVALLVGWLVPRAFCRYVCPYGVLLGLFSLVAWRRRTVDPSACVDCGKCQSACPVQAIETDRRTGVATVSSYQCVQCGRCSSSCRLKAVGPVA